MQWDGYTSPVESWRQALVDGWLASRLTLDELVGKTGLNRGTIHRVLDNKTKDPSFNTVAMIAAAFGPTIVTRVAESIGVTRPEQEPGHVGRREGNPILEAIRLRELDDSAPAEDSIRGDILRAQTALDQAHAALNRALRRPDAKPGAA